MVIFHSYVSLPEGIYHFDDGTYNLQLFVGRKSTLGTQ